MLFECDPKASPEYLIYEMSRDGVYFAMIKSSKVVKKEMEMLSIKANVKDLNKRDVLTEVRNLSNCKVVIEFCFDASIALKLKELAIENSLLLILVVLKDWYDEKSMSFLRYIADGIFVVESEKTGDKYSCKFSIPKMLGNINLQEFVKFRVKKKFLEIDTSKDI